LVTNYQPMLHSIPEEQMPKLDHGRGMKSCKKVVPYLWGCCHLSCAFCMCCVLSRELFFFFCDI